MAKILSDREKLEITKRLIGTEATVVTIAREYGVSPATIIRAVDSVRWRRDEAEPGT